MTMEEETTLAAKTEGGGDSAEGRPPAENANTAKMDEMADASAKSSGGGIFDTIKNFYEKADSMAASQALLLNKELEDRGIVEKITDETGLKVIGKEAAKELTKSARGNDDDSGDGGSGEEKTVKKEGDGGEK